MFILATAQLSMVDLKTITNKRSLFGLTSVNSFYVTVFLYPELLKSKTTEDKAMGMG